MSTYLAANRTSLMQQTYTYIGNQAYDLSIKDQKGFVPDSYYEEVHKYVIYLRALQYENLTELEEEPILACLANLVNEYPAISTITQP